MHWIMSKLGDMLILAVYRAKSLYSKAVLSAQKGMFRSLFHIKPKPMVTCKTPTMLKETFHTVL